MKTNVLVTGANGQLGQCFLAISETYPNINFTFVSALELNISNVLDVYAFFQNKTFDYCVNCAAYTKVDLAETEQDKAFLINAEGVQHLANVCKINNVTLIHISTDFVFDGSKTTPYLESDKPNPINVYGYSKLKGEAFIQSILVNYFIIRTSWLYSEFGHNFVKTMLKLASERDEINIVNDQIGSPTYAKDLAEFIIKIIQSNSHDFRIYNFSNQGEVSWYEFAKSIFELKNKKMEVYPIQSSAYPTLALRPKYSVLSTTKAEQTFGFKIKNWKIALKEALLNL